jgi:hypothetical protein
MEAWYVDNQSLRTLAWNIEAVPTGTGIPPTRGDNLVIPYRHGSRSRVKYYDERKLALSMFVLGCTPDGGIPDHLDSLATLYDNLDALRQLFGRRDSLLTLRRVLPDGSERTAVAEVLGTLDFDSVKGAVARFTVDMVMPDPFWYGPTTVETLEHDLLWASDTFDRSNDAANLGNLDGGLLEGQPWEILWGTWGIVDNQAYLAAAGGGDKELAVIDVGLSDCTVQVVLSEWANGQRVAFRYSDVDNGFFVNVDGAHYYIYRRQAGGHTLLWEGDPAPQDGDVVKVVLDGNSIQLYVNESLVASITDSFNQTATKHGLGANAVGSKRWNNFSIVGGWLETQPWVINHPGTFETANLVWEVVGACENPRLTHPSGWYVEVLATMLVDDILAVDCENFTATLDTGGGPVSIIGSLRHAGDPAFMKLLPGSNSLSLHSDSAPDAVATITYKPRYL